MKNIVPILVILLSFWMGVIAEHGFNIVKEGVATSSQGIQQFCWNDISSYSQDSRPALINTVTDYIIEQNVSTNQERLKMALEIAIVNNVKKNMDSISLDDSKRNAKLANKLVKDLASDQSLRAMGVTVYQVAADIR